MPVHALDFIVKYKWGSVFMKQFLKDQKITYNLMSFTGYKALILFNLLTEGPKSYNEICDYFMNHPYLREKISIDTLRVYINSLKRVGCEVKRFRGEDKESRYVILSHPFELKITPEQMQSIIKIYKSLVKNIDIKELLSLENFFEYFNSTNSDLNYMLDELYLALGKENVQSKFFHLFSIMEFIEKRFIKFSGASNLLTEDEVDKIVKYLSNIDMDFGKDKIEKITNTFRSNMLKMTDYGRATKLANILNYMGIKKIKYLNETIGVNGKEVAQIIKIRNCLFHGDVNGLKEDIDKKIQIAVEKLLIICGMIIEWVAGTDNAGINCDG